MKIIPIIPRGYCKGVVRAINLAKKAKKLYPNEQITMLGMIVHNKHVVQALNELGIKSVENSKKTRLELLDEITNGVVIFTAHGVSEQVMQKAKEKNLIILDASCDDVLKTQNLIKEKLQDNIEVLYIGKKNHPEAEAVLAINPHVHLICNTKDIDKLPNYNQVMITNQTTMSILEIQYLIDYALKKYPDLIVTNEICNATSIRQQAITKHPNLDLLYVVGDPKSNNSNKLKDVGLKAGIKKVILIETCKDIQIEHFKNIESIGITSGASTPTYLTNQVIECLMNYNQTKQLIYPEIDYHHLLDFN